MSPENNATFRNKALARTLKKQAQREEAKRRLEAKQLQHIDRLTAEALPVVKLYLEEDDIVDD